MTFEEDITDVRIIKKSHFKGSKIFSIASLLLHSLYCMNFFNKIFSEFTFFFCKKCKQTVTYDNFLFDKMTIRKKYSVLHH